MAINEAISNAMTELRAVVAGIDGLRSTSLKEKISAWPAGFAFADTVEIEMQSDWAKINLDASVFLVTDRTDLPRDVNEIEPYFGKFLAAIDANRRLNDTVETVTRENIIGILGPLPEIAGVPVFGWDITVFMKINATLQGDYYVKG